MGNSYQNVSIYDPNFVPTIPNDVNTLVPPIDAFYDENSGLPAQEVATQKLLELPVPMTKESGSKSCTPREASLPPNNIQHKPKATLKNHNNNNTTTNKKEKISLNQQQKFYKEVESDPHYKPEQDYLTEDTTKMLETKTIHGRCYKLRSASKMKPVKRKARLAANNRERKRMSKLNECFEDLREVIPIFPFETKLSKIDTLKVAMDYIQAMKEILELPEEQIYSDRRFFGCYLQK